MSLQPSNLRRFRAVLLLLAACCLGAAVYFGLQQRGDVSGDSSDAPSLDSARAQLAGAPAKLARLHRRAGLLLDGSNSRRFEEELARLEGFPIVVNKWASWCGPCRYEFVFFQRLSVDLGKKVAFVGLNSGDSRSGARRFLAEHPTSFPSFFDPEQSTARSVGAGRNFPTTLFFRADGTLSYVHQGQYSSEAKLLADIRRYALGPDER